METPQRLGYEKINREIERLSERDLAYLATACLLSKDKLTKHTPKSGMAATKEFCTRVRRIGDFYTNRNKEALKIELEDTSGSLADRIEQVLKDTNRHFEDDYRAATSSFKQHGDLSGLERIILMLAVSQKRTPEKVKKSFFKRRDRNDQSNVNGKNLQNWLKEANLKSFEELALRVLTETHVRIANVNLSPEEIVDLYRDSLQKTINGNKDFGLNAFYEDTERRDQLGKGITATALEFAKPFESPFTFYHILTKENTKVFPKIDSIIETHFNSIKSRFAEISAKLDDNNNADPNRRNELNSQVAILEKYFELSSRIDLLLKVDYQQFALGGSLALLRTEFSELQKSIRAKHSVKGETRTNIRPYEMDNNLVLLLEECKIEIDKAEILATAKYALNHMNSQQGKVFINQHQAFGEKKKWLEKVITELSEQGTYSITYALTSDSDVTYIKLSNKEGFTKLYNSKDVLTDVRLLAAVMDGQLSSLLKHKKFNGKDVTFEDIFSGKSTGANSPMINGRCIRDALLDSWNLHSMEQSAWAEWMGPWGDRLISFDPEKRVGYFSVTQILGEPKDKFIGAQEKRISAAESFGRLMLLGKSSVLSNNGMQMGEFLPNDLIQNGHKLEHGIGSIFISWGIEAKAGDNSSELYIEITREDVITGKVRSKIEKAEESLYSLWDPEMKSFFNNDIKKESPKWITAKDVPLCSGTVYFHPVPHGVDRERNSTKDPMSAVELHFGPTFSSDEFPKKPGDIQYVASMVSSHNPYDGKILTELMGEFSAGYYVQLFTNDKKDLRSFDQTPVPWGYYDLLQMYNKLENAVGLILVDVNLNDPNFIAAVESHTPLKINNKTITHRQMAMLSAYLKARKLMVTVMEKAKFGSTKDSAADADLPTYVMERDSAGNSAFMELLNVIASDDLTLPDGAYPSVRLEADITRIREIYESYKNKLAVRGGVFLTPWQEIFNAHLNHAVGLDKEPTKILLLLAGFVNKSIIPIGRLVMSLETFPADINALSKKKVPASLAVFLNGLSYIATAVDHMTRDKVIPKTSVRSDLSKNVIAAITHFLEKLDPVKRVTTGCTISKAGPAENIGYYVDQNLFSGEGEKREFYEKYSHLLNLPSIYGIKPSAREGGDTMIIEGPNRKSNDGKKTFANHCIRGDVLKSWDSEVLQELYDVILSYPELFVKMNLN